MQKDDSKLRVRRFRERQRAAKAAATVTAAVTAGNAVTCNGSNGSGFLFTDSIVEPVRPTETYKADARFAEFWAEYPRKVARKAAERVWKRVAVSDVRAEEILYGLRAHLPGLLAKELQFRPHASTWLNQERWADPVEPATAQEFRDDWRTRRLIEYIEHEGR